MDEIVLYSVVYFYDFGTGTRKYAVKNVISPPSVARSKIDLLVNF